MHDIDRTQAEFESDFEDFESDQFEFEDSFEFTEEFDSEIDVESPFSEVEEMELAAQLLEITDEAELDQFLGNLFKKAWRGLKRVGRGVFKPLGRVLKGVAKVALPIAGKALGGIVGGPAGAMIGGQLGSTVGKAFGLELEGLSQEDQEFEVARRYVRLAGAAARKAALSPPTLSPKAAVNNALKVAAQRHAPGLFRITTPMVSIRAGGVSGTGVPRRSGHWIRRGRKIIIYGV